jgi:hypothetical protein
MIVMMMAITPSLKASNRPLPICRSQPPGGVIRCAILLNFDPGARRLALS